MYVTCPLHFLTCTEPALTLFFSLFLLLEDYLTSICLLCAVPISPQVTLCSNHQDSFLFVPLARNNFILVPLDFLNFCSLQHTVYPCLGFADFDYCIRGQSYSPNLLKSSTEFSFEPFITFSSTSTFWLVMYLIFLMFVCILNSLNLLLF